MTCHHLTSDTGNMTAEQRRDEADHILILLEPEPEDHFTPRERDFIEQMSLGGFVSPKQLFQLRDIKDKYL
jgi:hypothetical protein